MDRVTAGAQDSTTAPAELRFAIARSNTASASAVICVRGACSSTRPSRALTSASSRRNASRRAGHCATSPKPSEESGPAIASSNSAASATVRASGPCVSRNGQVGITPVRGTSPNVGFIPTMPQNCAGIRLEPPSSVPSAAKAMPHATETAEPALEPPGVRVPVGSCGLRTCPESELVPLPRYAKSSATVLPSTTAPAARIRATSIASRATGRGNSRAHSALDAVVVRPFIS